MYLNYIKVKLIFEINEISSPFTGKDLFVSQLKKTNKKENFSVFYIYTKVCSYTNAKKKKKKKDTEVEQFCSFGNIFFTCKSFLLNSRILAYLNSTS